MFPTLFITIHSLLLLVLARPLLAEESDKVQSCSLLQTARTLSAKAYRNSEEVKNVPPTQHSISVTRRRRRSVSSHVGMLTNIHEATSDPSVVIPPVTSKPRATWLQTPRCSYSTKTFRPIKRDLPCRPQCPYSLFLPNDPCHKVCVQPERCGKVDPTRRFADKESKQCIATCGASEDDIIVGCATCVTTGICKKCVSGFTVTKDGRQCLDDNRFFWYCVYGTLGVIAVMLAVYLILLSHRPAINEEVLEHALKHRDHRKVWEEREDHVFYQYDFTTTMLINTDISGQGVILYFGFLTFACFLAGVLLIGSFIAYEFSDLKEHREVIKEGLNGTHVAQHCAHSTEHLTARGEQVFSDYQLRMFQCMASTYVVVLIASMVVVWYQTNISYRWDENNSTHEDYAVIAKGLPEDATDPKELTHFFEKALDKELRKRDVSEGDLDELRIIGVSIAYDYKANQDLIDNCLQDWIEELEVQKERRAWKSRPRTEAEMIVPSTDGRARSCFSFKSVLKLEFLDYIFLGSCHDAEDDKDHHAEQLARSNEIRGVLETLQSSGFVYVIGSKPVVGEILADIFHGPDPPKFRNTTKITLDDVQSEPPSLYWDNFTEMNFWPRIVLGMFVTLVTIVLWMGVYMVYAVSYSKYLSVPGAEPSFLEETLLGVLVAVGNAIVAAVVDCVTQWAGFRQKDRRDIAILSMAFLATLLNTACDLWMVMKIAEGRMHSNTFEGKSDEYDHIIAGELFTLIVPGYLILPYIATPVVEHVMPYVMGTWYIRSRKTSLRDAEACLACPEFDICWRYSDIMNNFTICSIMLTFVTPNSYRVMCWLVAFLLLIMAIDKYKLLRQTSQTFYTTRRLDSAAQLWWSFPTGVLAGIVVHWACKSELYPWMKGPHIAICALGFAIHVVLYVILWKITVSLVPPAKTEITDYEKMCDKLWGEGKVWSYFNTNPIFCLRSRYLDAKDPGARSFPCVPYVPGKVFLQQDVPLRFNAREESLFKGLRKSAKGLLGLSNTQSRSLRADLRHTQSAGELSHHESETGTPTPPGPGQGQPDPSSSTRNPARSTTVAN